MMRCSGLLVAAHARHTDVEQDDVGRGTPAPSRSLPARRPPSGPRCPSSRSSIARLDAASRLSSTTRMRRLRSGTARPRYPAAAVRSCPASVASGRDDELAPLALAFALRRDGAAVHLDQPPDECQADAQAALRAVSIRSTCVNMSKTRDSISAGMPIPLSRTGDDSPHALPLGGQPDVAARRGVLGRVVQQVREDLGQPGQVGVEPEALGGSLTTARGPRPRSGAGWSRAPSRRPARRRAGPGAARSCRG